MINDLQIKRPADVVPRGIVVESPLVLVPIAETDTGNRLERSVRNRRRILTDRPDEPCGIDRLDADRLDKRIRDLIASRHTGQRVSPHEAALVRHRSGLHRAVANPVTQVNAVHTRQRRSRRPGLKFDRPLAVTLDDVVPERPRVNKSLSAGTVRVRGVVLRGELLATLLKCQRVRLILVLRWHLNHKSEAERRSSRQSLERSGEVPRSVIVHEVSTARRGRIDQHTSRSGRGSHRNGHSRAGKAHLTCIRRCARLRHRGHGSHDHRKERDQTSSRHGRLSFGDTKCETEGSGNESAQRASLLCAARSCNCYIDFQQLHPATTDQHPSERPFQITKTPVYPTELP